METLTKHLEHLNITNISLNVFKMFLLSSLVST